MKNTKASIDYKQGQIKEYSLYVEDRTIMESKTKQRPLIFSFFSGAGFLDLGFELSGFDIAFVNEVHPPFLTAYKYSRKKWG